MRVLDRMVPRFNEVAYEDGKRVPVTENPM